MITIEQKGTDLKISNGDSIVYYPSDDITQRVTGESVELYLNGVLVKSFKNTDFNSPTGTAEEISDQISAIKTGGSGALKMTNINSDHTHVSAEHLFVDTTSNIVPVRIDYGTTTPLHISDAEKKFKVNSCKVEIYNADGVTVDHDLELDKKDKTYQIYHNGTNWAYREEGKGAVNVIASSYVASNDFPPTEDYVTNAENNNATSKSYDFYVKTDYTGSVKDGKDNTPYTDIQTAIDNASEGNRILCSGDFVITTDILLTKGVELDFTDGSTVGYASYNSSNGKVFYQSDSSSTKDYAIRNVLIKNAGDYGLRSKSSNSFELNNVKFANCGQDGLTVYLGVGNNGGLLDYTSTQAELQTNYSSSGYKGGCFRIENSKFLTVDECQQGEKGNNSLGSFRGFRMQNCGINGGEVVVKNNIVCNTMEAPYYFASSTYNENGGCENVKMYNNKAYDFGNCPLLPIGGEGIEVYNNHFENGWNSEIGWSSSSLTARNNTFKNISLSNFNAIGNVGDSNNSSSAIAGAGQRSTSSYILDARNNKFINDIPTASSQRIGFYMSSTVGSTLQDPTKGIVKLNDNTFNGHDIGYKIDANLDYITFIDNNNTFLNNTTPYEINGNGHYFKGNHPTLPDSDFTIDSTGSNISISSGGSVIGKPHGINSIQCIGFGTKIRIILKNSKIALHDIPVSGCKINGVLVNGELSTAVTEVNAFLTQTSSFLSSGGNPVADVNLSSSGDTLMLTFTDGTGKDIDVSTLNVDTDVSVAETGHDVVGDDLILAMNDGSFRTIDVRTLSTGHNPTYPSPDWYYAFGSQQDVLVSNNHFYESQKNHHPAYFGQQLVKGKELVWTYDGTGNLHIGIWIGLTNVASGGSSGLVANWLLKYRILSDSSGEKINFEDSTDANAGCGTDINTRYPIGYDLIAGSTKLAIRYMDNDKLGMFDITDGANILISQSNDTFSGAITFHSTGQHTAVQTHLPFWVLREDVYEFAHRGYVGAGGAASGLDIDWRDGTEQGTILKTISTFGPGQKMRWNINYTGSNQRWGLGYTGAATGETDPVSLLTDSFRYGSTESFYSMPDWTLNANAVHYDASLPSYGQNGVPIGEVEIRYQDANTITLWSVDNSERIATLDRNPQGLDQRIFFGQNQYDTALPHLPIITRMDINPAAGVASSAPSVSDQVLNTFEGANIHYIIQKDLQSTDVIQYSTYNLPSWLSINQATGLILGTAPAWTGTAGSGITNDTAVTAKAFNFDGDTPFTLTVKVGEDGQSTNWTKAYDFDSTSDNLKQASNSDSNSPLRKDIAKTQPWAIATVVNYTIEASNNTIWAQAINSHHDNPHVKMFVGASHKLCLQYGTASDKHIFTSTDDFSSDWLGVIVTYDGLALDNTSLSNLGETVSDRFTIQYVDLQNGTITDVVGAWSTVGNGSDADIMGDFHVASLYHNVNVFKGQIASTVVTTNTVGYTMQDAEKTEMVVDPMGWANTFRVGEDWRRPDETTNRSNWQFDENDATKGAEATKIWLNGDGANDSFPNIYNQASNNVEVQKIVANNMNSSQVINVSITGLS